MFRRSLLPLLLLLLAAPSGEASEVDAKERELQRLRARIESHRAKAGELALDERGQLARLAEIEKEIELLNSLVSQLTEREDELSQGIEALQDTVAVYEGAMAGRRDRLRSVLRVLYKRGNAGFLASALTARRPSELVTRMRALTHIARAERSFIDEVVSTQRVLAGQRSILNERLAQVYQTQGETEERRARLEHLKSERSVALKDVRKQRRKFEGSVQEMEQNAASLEQLVAQLEDRRRGAPTPPVDGDFSKQRGRLPWPVRGKILKPFGVSEHPEFKTVVMNKGINIGAPAGTPIHAVSAGIVDYVNWLPGYGKCVILNHGGGFYTLYAHAAEIYPAEGARVEHGEILGTVGDTGSLNGHQLYFEVRRGRAPMDPKSWLVPE